MHGRNFTTLGGGKTFHPKHPPDWDGNRSWSQQMPYYDFEYYKKNPKYPGPCPGAGGPRPTAGGSDLASKIDTWCALDEPDDHFYDHGLASNTIKQLQYAAGQFQSHGTPFFIQAGFARPHAPWRIPLRFWKQYANRPLPLARHKLPPTDMPGIAWHQQGFYNASDGQVFAPSIGKPIDTWVAQEMRHAYYAAVSWVCVAHLSARVCWVCPCPHVCTCARHRRQFNGC